MYRSIQNAGGRETFQNDMALTILILNTEQSGYFYTCHENWKKTINGNVTFCHENRTSMRLKISISISGSSFPPFPPFE